MISGWDGNARMASGRTAKTQCVEATNHRWMNETVEKEICMTVNNSPSCGTGTTDPSDTSSAAALLVYRGCVKVVVRKTLNAG